MISVDSSRWTKDDTWNLSSKHGSGVLPKISLLKSVIVYTNISSLTLKPRVPSN